MHCVVAGVYLTCTMATTTLAMVSTVFVGNLYERNDRPVPAWARTALLHYAARVLGYCTRCVDPPQDLEPSSPPPPPPVPLSQRSPDHDAEMYDDDGRSLSSWQQQAPPYRLAALQDARPDNGVDVGGSGDIYRPRSPSTSPAIRLIVRGSSTLGQATASVTAGRRRDRVESVRSYSKDWTNVGAVCDRLFFWLCLCLAVVTTVVLFQPLITRTRVPRAALDSSSFSSDNSS